MVICFTKIGALQEAVLNCSSSELVVMILERSDERDHF